MDAVGINRSLSIYTAQVKDEWGVSGSVTNFAENHSLGFLGGARLQERLKCQEGGSGCQECVAAQPVVWREGWVEDRDSLPTARDWQGSSREDLGPRREVCVLTVGEPLQPRVTGEASVVTARNCPPQSL